MMNLAARIITSSVIVMAYVEAAFANPIAVTPNPIAIRPQFHDVKPDIKAQLFIGGIFVVLSIVISVTAVSLIRKHNRK